MRITAVCAGLGLAVGGVLVLVLRFVTGRSALNAVPLMDVGMPRRYADYLPTDGPSTVDSLRLLPVGLGAGLVAGLLIGALLRVLASRRKAGVGRVLGPAALAVAGLVIGSLLAVELRSYGRHVARAGDVGWFSYSPLTNTSPGSDGILYGGGPAPAWWPLLVTGAVVGLVVGSVAAGLALWTGRTRRA